MATLYSNFANGTTTDNPLTVGATTINSANFANLPEVVAPDTMWLVLDPEGANGAPEIVQVTAHTASATSATIVRAQQSTTAREHPASTVWRNAATKADADAWLVTDDLDAALAGYATEAYVDDEISGAGSASIVNGEIVRRSSTTGSFAVPTPTFDEHPASKEYVDDRVTPTGGTLASGRIRYTKSAGIVHVVTSEAGWTLSSATLPAGFRPAVAIGGAAFSLKSGAATANTVTISTAGVISLGDTASVTLAGFSISFAAA